MIPTSPPDHNSRFGLLHWMERAVLLADEALEQGPSVDGVHDLRVALRRSLALFRGFTDVDGWPGWRDLRRLGRPLFRALGELRDIHVLRQWLDRLSPPRDPLAEELRRSLDRSEAKVSRRVHRALESFDRTLWLEGGRRATERTRHLQPDGLPFQHTALRRLEEATHQHREAVISGLPEDYHRLRICLKKVRYTLENFLPRLHRRWKHDLKRAQDLLGDLHDVDVLWYSLRDRSRTLPPGQLEPWRAVVARQRQDLLVAYLGLAGGKKDLLARLRSSLPTDDRLEVACLAHLGAWASFLTPDYASSRRVAGLAVRILDGMREARLTGPFLHTRYRKILYAAGLLHGTGRSIRLVGHHKLASRLVRAHRPPVGWSEQEMLLTALVVRYQRGAGPKKKHRPFRDLSASERQAVRCLAGILRQAIVLEPLVEQPFGVGVRIGARGDEVVIRAALKEDGNGPLDLLLASEAELLEGACARRVVVESIAPREVKGKPA